MEKEVLNEPMLEEQEHDYTDEQHYAQEIVALFRSDISAEKLLEDLEDYHDNDIAEAFEMLSPMERKKFYPILGPDRMSDIFSYIEDADEYIKELDVKNLAEIVSSMDSDDAVDFLEDLDEDLSEKVSELLDEETSADIELIRSYDEDEVGSLLTTNFIIIQKGMTVKQAMRAMISQAEKNDNISTIYVEDEEEKYYGALDLKDLIIARASDDLEDIISTSYPYVHDHEIISEVLERIRDYNEDSLPVVNDDMEVIGIITAQDLIEVVDDEMGDDYAKFAGLTAEEDLNETLPESMKKRMPWLLILLFLGIVVSTVVGLFEGVVSQLALVVAFQSLILDMAGNVGTQSLAVTIRVLMDENLNGKQKAYLVFKEMRVGLSNGILLGILTVVALGFYIMIFKGKAAMYAFSISGCVGFSLLVAMIISSFVGTVIPMFFHKIKIDPAVASGPLITTINDLVAVVTYYGLSWILLINMLQMTG